MQKPSTHSSPGSVLRNADQSSYGGKRNLSEADLAEVKKLSAKKSKKKVKKPKNATPSDAADAIDNQRPLNQYRDRAAERRRGEVGEMVDVKAYTHLNIEQSKFLGGDMAHTHLVKGLDYALLGQLKREKEKLLAEKQKLGDRVCNEKIKPLKPGDVSITFKTGLGRLVYFHACQSTLENTTSVKSELFLPGRMYYTYNLLPTEIESVPVSIQRSKEDCPEPDEVASGLVDESLIERVAAVMVHKISGKKKRKKRMEHHLHRDGHSSGGGAAGSAVTDVVMGKAEAAIDDEDGDIFPEMGPYIPIDQRVDNTLIRHEEKEAIKKTGYFSNLSAAITEKENAARKKEEGVERAWKETLQKAVETQQKIERDKERREKAAKMTGEADDYAEYQDIGALGDSDDEVDEETTRRRKAAGLSKKDCNSEEKARRKKQKEISKFASDLEKIGKIMAEKSNKQ